MKCDVCGIGDRERKEIRYTLTIEDRLVVIDHVPADVCPNCGEISFSPEVAERLQQTAWGSRQPSRSIETQVYEFV